MTVSDATASSRHCSEEQTTMSVAMDDLVGSAEQSEHRCCCLQHIQTTCLMTMHLLHSTPDCMHKPGRWIILRGICWTDMYPVQENG